MARAQKRQTAAVKLAEARYSPVSWGGMLVGGLVAIGMAIGCGLQEPSPETVQPVEIVSEPAPRRPATPPPVERLRVRVIRKYPHDTDAFTQGLLWHDGVLYESTGQYGKSSLRRIRLEDGRVLAERALEPSLFGEGLALVHDRLIQLTWRSGMAVVSDLDTLARRETLRYPGEGWGLCFDGKALAMSDGSSILEFRDPESMALLREVTVMKNGHPVRRLNELECVGSDIYANIWQREEIVRIDGRTGRVTATIDASGLLSPAQRFRADVLNGIAYKPDSETFLLTGKLWPQLFEVELVAR
jgi:glutaminyl-peptide cyclotransferase